MPVEIRHGHLFCGIGAGAKGFNRARPSVGTMTGVFRCVGGIDVDPQAIADFGRMTGVPGTVLDLFDRDQYIDFHGREPGADWREAGTAEIHRAFGWERPHIVFLSAPCKGFSGLLSESKSKTAKYQALNRCTERGVWLSLEAYKDDPVELYLFENVPRISTRGRPLVDRIMRLFRAYGYAVAETTHDCGEIGGLAQSRKRFLMVARHMEKVPPFLYQPTKKPLRAVGDVLGRMPMPGDALGGPMHRIPSLQWKTWVRLAFVQAGSDWRSLNKLMVEDGQLRDYLIMPTVHSGLLGVNRWAEPMGTVTSRGLPNNGNFAIADPRFDPSAKWLDGQALGVRRWEESTGAIAGQQGPLQGAYSVADPRHGGPAKHSNEFRIIPWNRAAQAVTSAHGTGQAVADPRMNWGDGAHQAKLHLTKWDEPHQAVTGARGPYSGAVSVADPRQPGQSFGKYAVTGYDAPAGTVISGSTTGQGAFAVADPRPNMQRGRGDHYLTGGHYGVVPWDRSSYSVAASACLDNGHWSLADPRPNGIPGAPDISVGVKLGESHAPQTMPTADEKLVCRIESLDGTWHRPFTTLELAALQSLFDPDDWFHPESEYFTLEGNSDQRWREGIGNAVPSDAATAIAEVMGETLLLAWAGETFQLSMKPIWVQPLAIAISVRQGWEWSNTSK
ncbi:DNA cytosine methyltransferase [Rhodoferax sp.]|uniref:DNA cytosine methyltransferase n=1 Tax=Rhodoferax sp. TaxID=50421 RepID=UPI002774F6F8|nr:DNA cytosine methyltransferase [Rhodoferax sp.]